MIELGLFAVLVAAIAVWRESRRQLAEFNFVSFSKADLRECFYLLHFVFEPQILCPLTKGSVRFLRSLRNADWN